MNKINNKYFLVVSIIFLFFVYFCYIIINNNNRLITYRNYNKIKIGMTMDQAVLILGPSQELGRTYVPRDRRGLVIKGERFFMWKDTTTGKTVWVGVENKIICDKFYWEPSF
jgi:hypothetical protein